MEAIKNYSKGVLKKALLISLGLSTFFALSLTAFAADGDVTTVTLLDSNNDGKLNSIYLTVQFANAGGAGAACTTVGHATNEATTIAQFTVVDAITEAGVTVTSIAQQSAAAGVSCTVELVLDNGDVDLSTNTAANALNVIYENAGNNLIVTDGANPVNVGAILTGLVETDGANPVLTGVVLGNSGGKNNITFSFSEPMFIDLDQDGYVDGDDIVDAESTASTATYGSIDSAGSILSIGNFATVGNYDESAVTGHTISLASSAKNIAISFNTAAGAYFTSGSTAVSGAFTADTLTTTAYFIAQGGAGSDAGSINAVQNIAADVTPTASGSWDTTAPSTPTGFEKQGSSDVSGTLRDYFGWAPVTASDFGTYFVIHSTTLTDVTTPVLSSVTQWGGSQDTALLTAATKTTQITSGLTNGTETNIAILAADTAGNLSSPSNSITTTPGSSGGAKPIAFVDTTTTTTTTTTDTDTGTGTTTTDTTTTDTTTTDTTTTDTTTTDTTTTTSAKSFSDLPSDHWATAAVVRLASKGIVKGNEDGSFNPAGNLNRAEAAAFVHRAVGLAEPSAPSAKPYGDVDASAWYAGYINGLKDLGILNSTKANYSPAGSMNRAEFIQLVMKAHYYYTGKTMGDATGTTSFTDVAKSQWYYNVVLLAEQAGYVKGSACTSGTGTCLRPASNINRAEVTVILDRVFGDTL